MAEKTPEERAQEAAEKVLRDVAAEVADKLDQPVDLGPLLRKWVEEKLPHAAKDQE